MRIIQAADIEALAVRLILSAEFDIPYAVRSKLLSAHTNETNPNARFALGQILENHDIASAERTPMCQDTGIIVMFAEVGQEVYITGGAFEDVLQAGAGRAFNEGYLRASVVSDPIFDRINTRDNSPAIIHTRIVPGDRIRLLVIPKGFGSENMSRVGMLTPSDSVAGVRAFIIETARLAGSNPCPPVVLGVGVGGTLEECALIAKRMTVREHPNADPRYAALEEDCLAAINALSIGAAGFGGSHTAIAVNIGWAPTHIAGLPVVVNVCCHAARHAEGEI